MAIAGLLGVLLITLIATLAFGFVAGEEFAPESFARRSFWYYEIPLLHIQITPIDRDDETNELERYLRAQKYVAPSPPPSPRWDMVRVAQGATEVYQGDAAILCAYLDAVDQDGKFFWKLWSEQHPELARILWPAVARVAAQQLYLLVPEMFERAQSAEDPEAFSRELHRMLAERYRRLSEIQRRLGRDEIARTLHREALRHDRKTLRPQSQR